MADIANTLFFIFVRAGKQTLVRISVLSFNIFTLEKIAFFCLSVLTYGTVMYNINC